MCKVLVTGANGFLAGNTINELLKRGYKVRGMHRKPAKLNIDHKNLSVYTGNITDEKDASEAVEGCKMVIHIAALTDQSVADYNIYKEVNIGGTLNIIKAALEHKVTRIIYVSTANTFGYGTKDNPGDETLPMTLPFTKSGYARSKFEAQKLIIEKLADSGTIVSVVNPTFMIGPHDYKISSNRIIIRALGKQRVVIPPGGKNFIHVSDAAAGVCNALEHGENGECYILGNENLSYHDFYTKMAEVTKKELRLVKIPERLLLAAGIAGNIVRSAGINTQLGLTNMRILSTGNYYSAGKAVKYLGLPATPVEKAIEEAVRWFRNLA